VNDTIRPPGAPQVLVVDDEPQILMIMRFALETAGFTVVTATDGAQAWSTFKQRRFDLVVLDLMIPVVSGVAVAERIRGISDVPIMMITALSDEPDRIRGLEAGADDYVTKPFSPRELTLRAQALVRRWHGRRSPALSNGDLMIDTASHRVYLHGSALDMSDTEVRFLEVLPRHMDYFLIRLPHTSGGEGLLIRRRGAGDIWQGLYEFPLIETGETGGTVEELTKLPAFGDLIAALERPTFHPTPIAQCSHKLSHRAIYARLFLIEAEGLSAELPYQHIPSTERSSYAFPVLIERLLEQVS